MSQQRAPFLPLGESLKLLRESRGLSRGLVARRAGLSRQAVSGYEIGRNCPSFVNGVRILAAIGASLEELLNAAAYLRELRELKSRYRATVGGEMRYSRERPEKPKSSGVEKPVSLDPLDFEEALRALLRVKPEAERASKGKAPKPQPAD